MRLILGSGELTETSWATLWVTDENRWSIHAEFAETSGIGFIANAGLFAAAGRRLESAVERPGRVRDLVARHRQNQQVDE